MITGVVDFLKGEASPSRCFDYVEFRINNIKDLEKIRTIDRWCIAHAPDPQEEEWQDIIKELADNRYVRKINTHARSEETYLLCDECGVRLINTHQAHNCDWCGNIFRDEFKARAHLNSMDNLVEKFVWAQGRLSNEQTLVVENTYEPPSYFVELFSKLPDPIGFTLDVGHANIYHCDSLDYLYLLRSRLSHLHLHDNMGGNSEHRHDSHSAPGSGTVRWHTIRRALNAIRFAGTCTFECEVDPEFVSWWSSASSSKQREIVNQTAG